MFSPDLINGLKLGQFTTKLRARDRFVNVTLTVEDNRIFFNFNYNAELIDVIKKQFSGRRYHGFIEGDGRKLWSVPISQRNLFRLDSLRKDGPDPYQRWMKFQNRQEEVKAWYQAKGIEPYKHQVEISSMILGVHWFLAAAEMGLGKTLSTMCAIELFLADSNPKNTWWVGPLSALSAAELEVNKWKIKTRPLFMSYNRLVSTVAQWGKGQPAPLILVLDESSRCKTPKTQRTDAAQHVANSMRVEHGWDKTLIVELSGDPAPKAPTDWWAQAEIVCPGFLSEGSIYDLQERVAIIEQTEGPTGNYRKVVAWRDSESKCAVCGKPQHAYTDHIFTKGKNEVDNLGKRLSGLVRVWRKKDCLDLPDKRYELRVLQPSTDLLNIARTIIDTETRGADALIKLRTLSDGFLYKNQSTDEKIKCDACNNGKVEEHDGSQIDCNICQGSGFVPKIIRTVEDIGSPKIELFDSILEEHEECGRLVTYAAFTGSIEKLLKRCHQNGWQALRADGHAWELTDYDGSVIETDRVKMLERFQTGIGRICFVANAGSAGMGLTLTASPSIFFYSNDFNPDSRSQAEDRIYRIGMDVNRGARMIDCILLPTDRKILTSLKESRDLSNISLSALRELYA